MAKTPGNRHNGHMGGYHQACIGVAQAVNRDRREIMLPHELGKPCCHLVQVQRRTIPPGEKQVIWHGLAVLYLHSACPCRAYLHALAALV